jgi:hypothetical protein
LNASGLVSSFHGAAQPFSSGVQNERFTRTACPYPRVRSACGRVFDPAIYLQMLQAMMDRQWLAAIQLEVKKDKEYIEMMRSEGGVAQELDIISRKFGGSDDEFMQALSNRVKVDRNVALGICALQDGYVAIKKKRDMEKTRLAAEGKTGHQFRDEVKKTAH